jgi:SAM-dependent methyltransferase
MTEHDPSNIPESHALEGPVDPGGASGDAWLSSTLGRVLLTAEKDLLDAILPNLFGYYLLIVGALSWGELVSASRIRNRVCIASGRHHVRGSGECATLRGWPGALPVATDSVDVVLLPHVLEFEDSPHDALREADRVLVPEGHVVVTGLNPFSLMGVWRALAGSRALPPWSGRFVSVTRLRDWIALLGFEVVALRTAFFRPPIGNPTVLERLRWIEASGARLWPYAGGLYLLVARKRVTTLTPIKPRWRPRRSLVGIGLAEPSARRLRPSGGGSA